MTRAFVMLSVCLVACSSGGSSTPDGGGGAGGAAGVTGSGGAAGATTGAAGSAGAAGAGGSAGAGGGGSGDQALCTSSCSTFASCGVTVKTTCVADCGSASASYRTCIAAGTDCNALALCYFKAAATADCAAGGGVPVGTATCMATDTCEGTCNTNSSGPSCRCACVAAADPSVANLLLGINSCATNMCATECTGTSGPTCNTCFDTSCGTPRTACLAH